MEKFFLLLVLFYLVLLGYGHEENGYLEFGESCALSGVSGNLGSEYSRGIDYAFSRFNNRGGLCNSMLFNVTVKDDQYEPEQCVDNTLSFINNSFALIGYVGTPTTAAVSDIVLENQIPMIGCLTGASFLRTPFQENFINVRASYNDEASAMVHYLVRKLYVLRIAIVYQNDSFGVNCLQSLQRSLDPYELEIVSSATYTRNQPEDIDEALLEDIHAGEPKAIILAGTYNPLGKFIHLYETTYQDSGVIYLSFSFTGTVAIANTLESYGTNLQETRVVVFEVVPNFADTSSQLVDEYLTEVESSDFPPTFKNLEGYLVGRTTIEMIRGIYGSISRESFLESVFDYNQEFHVGELTLGKYSRKPGEECNQGLNELFPVRILNSTSFEDVTEAKFEWEGCLSEPSISGPVIFFKQSASLSGSDDLGLSYQHGLRAAFFDYNIRQALDERVLGVDSRDDFSNPDLTYSNLEIFIYDEGNTTFGLAGFMGGGGKTDLIDLVMSSGKPYLGAFTGAKSLRQIGMKNVINIRAGYDEELGAIIQLFLNKKRTFFSVLYQESNFGVGLRDVVASILSNIGLELFSSASFPVESLDLEEPVRKILYDHEDEGMFPEVIIMIGTYTPLARFVKLVLEEEEEGVNDIYFASVSTVGPVSLLNALKEENLQEEFYEKIYISEVVPNFNDSRIPLVEEYQKNMKYLDLKDTLGFVSLEGYLTGKLISEVLDSFTFEEINELQSEQLIDRIYSLSVIPLGDEEDDKTIILGPYIDDDNDDFCNVGLRKVWITFLENQQITMDDSSKIEFSTCHFDFVPIYPTFFGMSVDLEIPISEEYARGLDYAFSEYEGQLRYSNLFLLLRNDHSNETERLDNINFFERKQVFAYIGFERYSQSIYDEYGKKFVAPVSPVFGEEVNENVYYLRPFLIDEVFYCVKYYESQGKKTGILFRENGPYRIRDHLDQLGFSEILIYGSDSKIIGDIQKRGFDVIVYLMDEVTPLQDKILPKITVSMEEVPEFVFLSNSYNADIKDIEPPFNYTFVSLFSRTSTFFDDFKYQYGEYFDGNFDFSFLAYITGKWVVSNYIGSLNHELSFWENIHYQDSFDIEHDVVIKFGIGCNIGIKQIFLYNQNDELVHSEDFDECSVWREIVTPSSGEVHDSHHSDIWIVPVMSSIGFIFGILVLCFLCFVVLFCCICCFVGFGCLAFFSLFFLLYNLQRRKLKEFEKIDDIYVLLEENKVRKSDGRPLEKFRKKVSLDSSSINISYKDIKLVEVIGQGGSDAIVFKCMWAGKFCAFKCFRTNNVISFRNQEDSPSYDNFFKEATIMSNIRHPNICSFFGVCISDKRFGFVMEYCPRGDLANYIFQMKAKEKRILFSEKMRMFIEIASALAYLHDVRKIVHRDLKCENVLLTESLTCKVVDFGISRTLENTQMGLTRSIGTNIYMAPEIASGEYSDKCDVYSFSILMFVLLSENLNPFDCDSHTVHLKVANNPYYRPQWSIELKKLVPPWIRNLIITNWDHNAKKRKKISNIHWFLTKKVLYSQHHQNNVEIQHETPTGDDSDQKNEDLRGRNNVEEKDMDLKYDDEIVVFLKRLEEDESKTERFFLTDRSINGLIELTREKWENEVVEKFFTQMGGGGMKKELSEDRHVEELENEALVHVKFFELGDQLQEVENLRMELNEAKEQIKRLEGRN